MATDAYLLIDGIRGESTDSAHPGWIEITACAMGKTVAPARLEFMRADGLGVRVKYYEVRLENVLIANMDQLSGDGGLLHDQIGLRFAKVKWLYMQQKISGGAGHDDHCHVELWGRFA